MEISLAMSTALKAWREANELKVNEAAEKAGVTSAMWSRWEHSVRQVPAERAVELERRIGIPRHLLRPDLFTATEAQQ